MLRLFGVFRLPESIFSGSVRRNSNKAAVCKTNRWLYIRKYPTMFVQPNGSTITVRYPVPRRIVMLPVDLTKLSAEEKKQRLLKRKPKTKIILEEDIEDNYDVNRYSHLWRK